MFCQIEGINEGFPRLFLKVQCGLCCFCSDSDITWPHPQGHLNNAQYLFRLYSTTMNSDSLISELSGVLFTIVIELKRGLPSARRWYSVCRSPVNPLLTPFFFKNDTICFIKLRIFNHPKAGSFQSIFPFTLSKKSSFTTVDTIRVV